MAVVQMPFAERLVKTEADIWLRPDLSFKARALYAFLRRYDGFLPKVGDVERLTGLGKDARQAGYAELRRAGLLETRVGTWSQVKGGA